MQEGNLVLFTNFPTSNFELQGWENQSKGLDSALSIFPKFGTWYFDLSLSKTPKSWVKNVAQIIVLLMGTGTGNFCVEKFLLSGHEKAAKSPLIGDLSCFFANFCINSFPRTFADTQQSLTSQSRFANIASKPVPYHTIRETAFFLSISGVKQVPTFLLRFSFL